MHMSVIDVKANKCDVCGHVWIPRGASVTCANNDCRSRKWNAGTLAALRVTIKDIEMRNEEKYMAEYVRPAAPPVAMPAANYSRPSHNSSTCRVYACGLCKVKP
jgi:hypothetical protein